jgi:NAD+ synthase
MMRWPEARHMFSSTDLGIDAEAAATRIAESIQQTVLGDFRRKGAVVGVSGGIDSAVVAALCVRALGKDRVLALFMPERHSSDDATRLGKMLTDSLGVETITVELSGILEALGCYRSQDEAIRTVVPEYGPGWRCKLVLPSILESDRLNLTRLTVQSPAGAQQTVRLTHRAYLQIVAATNYKQRVRKMTEYYHADRLNYAVSGTPNRLEYDQGFFVKQGDGAADFKPIAHLYKTQVYALASHLGVPAEICARPPTTDTFSMAQTQEEFYFALPYAKMDLCLYAMDHNIPASEVAPVVGISEEQVGRVFRDIEAKRRAARYLHEPPRLVEPLHHAT